MANGDDPRIVQIARGLVRPITAYSCLIVLIISYATGRELDPAIVGLIGTVIGFYFGDRSATKAYENVNGQAKNNSHNP